MRTSADPSPHPAVQRWLAWQRLGDRLTRVLAQPSPELPAAVSDLAQQVDRLMAEDTDLGVFEVIRISPDKLPRYGSLHSLHTAVVVWLVAQRKEWTPARRHSALCAALSMNLAVTGLQTTLAMQAAPMQHDQQEAMRRHPLDGVRLLAQWGVQDEDWLTAVAQHHEQAGGGGYPLGLATVHELADVLRTCDVFCAKMSPRAGRGALLSPSAAQAIFRQRSAGYFGATVVSTLGLYPPGCLVGLGSGEAAIVLRRTRDLHRPEVAVLTSPAGTPLPQPLRSATGRQLGRPVLHATPDPRLASLFPPEQLLSAA